MIPNHWYPLVESKKLGRRPVPVTRMGEKLEQKILRGIENYKRRAGRFLLNFVDRMATELTTYLSDVEGVEKVTPAGAVSSSVISAPWALAESRSTTPTGSSPMAMSPPAASSAEM